MKAANRSEIGLYCVGSSMGRMLSVSLASMRRLVLSFDFLSRGVADDAEHCAAPEPQSAALRWLLAGT